MVGKSIIIIGAGIAGLAAGCYAQMNGYQAQIFEKHELPGGLCTAWKRKGYTIDGCIHYLIGSAPNSGFYRYWQEVGVIQGRQFFDQDTLLRVEGRDGRVFTLYADSDRLEKHMLELSPVDQPAIHELIEGLRFFATYEPPIDAVPEITGPLEGMKLLAAMLPTMGKVQKWAKMTIDEFAGRFKDPLLQEGLRVSLLPQFPMMLLLMTLAWLERKTAGYPIGGSLPLARAVEKRFLALGGAVHYHSPVKKILVEEGRAVGIVLEDGREQRADIVISAADGRQTLYHLLGEPFLDDKTRGYYQEAAVYPSMMYMSLGVNRVFTEAPTVFGVNFPLETPVQLGGSQVDRLGLHIYSYDPKLAHPGKTLLTVPMDTRYAYWQALGKGSPAYEAQKEGILQTVIALLDRRYPGLAGQVEMADLATPLTYEGFTGNWLGSTQGWLPTPKNVLAQMKRTLPGLKAFYLAGQWVEPGGGLPAALRSGRNVVRILCKRDHIAFTTQIPEG